MSEHENIIRAIISTVLFLGGLFLTFCAAGNFDWDGEEPRAIGESALGIAALLASAFVGKDVEFDDD